MSELTGKHLVMLEGWSVLPRIKALFPDIHISEVADTRDALLMVMRGDADATLDMSLMLEQAISQHYMKGLVVHSGLEELAPLPTTLHIKTRQGLEPLADIIDEAVAQIPAEAIAELNKKWFSGLQNKSSSHLPVVPYQHLQELPQQPLLQNNVEAVSVDGRPYFSFASAFTHDNTPAEYFAMMLPAENVYERSLRDLSVSVLIIALVWMIFMPMVLIFLVLRPLKKMAQKQREHR